MLVYRFGRWRYSIKNNFLRKPLSLLYKVLYKLVQILTGIELPCEVEIGDSFVIDHFGGIIISGYAKFGDNCRIRNGVVVGLKNLNSPTAPQFGNNVDIGAGAKILGNIRIGNNVLIGANAVVLEGVKVGKGAVVAAGSIVVKDVEPNTVVAGVPAKLLKKVDDKTKAKTQLMEELRNL
jgi:serine O-acetyltransferase